MASAAPTTSSTKETTNYARLCRQLVDVGTQALRDTFDAIHPPANLHTVLAANKSTLQTLKTKKVINSTQWGKLFPAISTSVSSANFDITLLMVLLRNLCGLPSPAAGWDTLPAVTDVSREADIARVKYYRNTVYAHAERALVDDATFNTYWRDIRDTLVRLGGVKYRAAIDNLETECMDPEIEDHFKELLSQWKKDEENIKDELKGIGAEIKNVIKKLDDLTASNHANRIERVDEGTVGGTLKLGTSATCKEKHHENEPLDHYCQNCKVCICYKCGQTRHTHHIKVDIQQAAGEQTLKVVEIIKEMKVEITDQHMQIEKTKELLKKSKENIAAARNHVLTTVEELIRVLKDHEVAMVTQLDLIEEEQQRDCATQLEHFQISIAKLKASVEHCETILQRNNNVEILDTQQGVIERCKGLLNPRKMNIYKPLHLCYEINEEDVNNVKQAFLGQVIVSQTDPLYSVAEGKGLDNAEVGRETTFTITTNNSEGRQYYNDIDQFAVEIQTPLAGILAYSIKHKKDGEYTVSYTPDCDGNHEVMIAVNDQPLTGSPWSVHVTPHQYQAVTSFGSRGKGRGQFDCPCDIAINHKTGNIAVADYGNNRVQIFSPDGSYLREYGRKGSGAQKLNKPIISVGFTGYNAVLILNSGSITRFTEDGGHFIRNFSNNCLIEPGGITIACDGRIIVCDWGDNTVKVLSPDGTELLQSFSAPDCHTPPIFALYHQGMFYVSYAQDHCIKVFSGEGVFLYDFGGEEPGKLNCALGLAVDKFDNIIVCDSKNSTLQVFTLDGKFVNSIEGQFSEPWTVVVSTTGQLFVTDVGKHCVHVFQ